MKKPLIAALILVLAACGGGGSDSGTDAPGAGIDVIVNSTITISGVASEISASGRTPLTGVQIVAQKVSDDSVIAMTTSAADGTFSISAQTTGTALDAYLVATKTGLKDTYLYPPAPLTMDFANIPIFLLKQSNQDLANQLAGADSPNAAADGWIGVVVQDAAAAPVAGAIVTASPTGQIHYNSAQGLPQAQAMATAADGTAYVMNVPAGQVTLGATKTGATFHSHAVNARANKVTLTLITP